LNPVTSKQMVLCEVELRIPSAGVLKPQKLTGAFKVERIGSSSGDLRCWEYLMRDKVLSAIALFNPCFCDGETPKNNAR